MDENYLATRQSCRAVESKGTRFQDSENSRTTKNTDFEKIKQLFHISQKVILDQSQEICGLLNIVSWIVLMEKQSYPSGQFSQDTQHCSWGTAGNEEICMSSSSGVAAYAKSFSGGPRTRN